MKIEKQILDVVLNMQANQIEMQKDITELQAGQKQMQKDISGLQDGQKQTQKDIQSLYKKVDGLENKVDGLEYKVDELALLRRQDSINIAKILEVQTEQFRQMQEAI